ncbi:MAG: hypothetical protein PHY34_01100 [Patescibacteria group bacterium]|nr:hypothetical protein [Patescibacteria group bacterium]MDD5715184.1 hypothetical protein [Patescibacteria group bacterium]
MGTFLIFIWIYAAMVATAFWEAYVEGRNAWDRGKLGWKIKVGNYTFTAYHFFLFAVMWPLLLTLPFIMFGWDKRLFGIVVSAFASGSVLEDFLWYVVNPAVKLSELNTDFANYYPRVRIGNLRIPVFYFIGIAVSILSWLLLWR